MEDLPPLGAPGQRLGRYELIQRIAVGGMAEVYRAYAVGPGDFRKLVAIKRLLPQHALDPQLLRMFLDESRLMARFAHPHLPHVLDVNDGVDDEVPFFVMEYVAGVDLRDILRAADGPLPIEQLVALGAGVAAGLHHAHELRDEEGRSLEIVHRDVSPSNVLVSFDGGVKVTDFGVAKWLQQKSFTYQGQLKGKFAHMSPEQCRAEPLDRRSDIFALGTLLYEMATGEPPFKADSEFELLSQIVSQDAPWPPGEVAPELAAIIMRSLHRDRNQRYDTAQEIQLAIESFAREQRLVASPVGLAAYVASLFPERVEAWRSSAGSSRSEVVRGGPPELTAARTATDTFALEKTLVSTTGEQAVLVLPVPVAAPSRRRWLIASGFSAAALLAALGIYAAERPAEVVRDTAARATTVPHPEVPPAKPAPAPSPALAEKSPTADEPTPAEATRPERTRAGRTRKSRKETAVAPSPVDEAPHQVVAPAAVVPEAPPVSPSPPRPSPPPHPAQTKVWDPDSPVPP
ncbi:MAG TPA: serine/threonine-protein kinase [Polyangia bacterium]|jgi:tRNA A-37 threonylcarbamoyl transferase component Bud32